MCSGLRSNISNRGRSNISTTDSRSSGTPCRSSTATTPRPPRTMLACRCLSPSTAAVAVAAVYSAAPIRLLPQQQERRLLNQHGGDRSLSGRDSWFSFALRWTTRMSRTTRPAMGPTRRSPMPTALAKTLATMQQTCTARPVASVSLATPFRRTLPSRSSTIRHCFSARCVCSGLDALLQWSNIGSACTKHRCRIWWRNQHRLILLLQRWQQSRRRQPHQRPHPPRPCLRRRRAWAPSARPRATWTP